MPAPYRVLVVDDSALSREALRRAIETDPELRVVGEAKTGEEAVRLVASLSPDLVTMDVQMPGMGGLRAIEVIMRERPTPIVVISERSPAPGTDLNYEALSRGALELVPKSAVFGAGRGDVQLFAGRLCRLIEESRSRDVTAGPLPTIPVSREPPLLLGVGASTGGPRALAKLISGLPADFPLPIAVVQHMAEDFFDGFVHFLGESCGRPVEQVSATTTLEPGRVYVAPPRLELFVRETLTVRLLPPPPDSLISPSIDSLFFSMANALKGRGVGVLLSGMGDDGAQGLLRMRRLGAHTIVQSRESCAVFGMPKAAIELGAAEVVAALEELPAMLAALAKGVPTRRTTSGSQPSLRRRVLIVDDDPQALAQTRKVLEDGGYEVHVADNPLLVAGLLRRTTMDLVLLETELTAMAGALVMEALRKHGLASVPVFLHSGLPEAQLKARAAECGAVGFVAKSRSSSLLHEVDAFLGGAVRNRA